LFLPKVCGWGESALASLSGLADVLSNFYLDTPRAVLHSFSGSSKPSKSVASPVAKGDGRVVADANRKDGFLAVASSDDAGAGGLTQQGTGDDKHGVKGLSTPSSSSVLASPSAPVSATSFTSVGDPGASTTALLPTTKGTPSAPRKSIVSSSQAGLTTLSSTPGSSTSLATPSVSVPGVTFTQGLTSPTGVSSAGTSIVTSGSGVIQGIPATSSLILGGLGSVSQPTDFACVTTISALACCYLTLLNSF